MKARASVALLTFAGSLYAWTAPALANLGGDGGASAVCPGGSAPWEGTQVAPGTPVDIQSEQQVTCHEPQVTVTTGSSSHSSPSGGPPNGTACTEHMTSAVQIGPVAKDTRTVAYYDPNKATVVTQTIPDAPSDTGYTPAQYTSNLESLWGTSEFMGSYDMSIPWILNGTFQAGACTGQWTPENGTRCPGTCYPVPTPTLRAPLAFVAPPPSALQPLIQSVKARFFSQYVGGQVVAQWADGGYVPQTGLIVRKPTCFWEQGSTIPPTARFGMTSPQPGTGPALVVTYVVRAITDELWWDFGDGQTLQQPGTDPATPCTAKQTYYHVSADAYGSGANHQPPPGVAWTGGTEAQLDMQAVDLWRHVHFTVTAYYQQTDGSQVAVPLSVGPQADFWIASTPLWVRVYQAVGVPEVCPCPTPTAS